MKYNDVNNSIKILLENYCDADKYSLKPETLYNNIVGTLKTSSVEMTAKIFEVSESLVWMIEKGEKDAL